MTIGRKKGMRKVGKRIASMRADLLDMEFST